MIEFRLLKVGEEEQFICLKQESLKVAPHFLLERTYEPTIEQVTREITDPNSEMVHYVLVIDNEILGMCQAYIHPGRPHSALTKSLYIRRDERVVGKRLGEELHREMNKYLRDVRGVEMASGGIVIGNTGMEQILTNLGYEKKFTDHKYIKLTDGKYVGIGYWYKFEL